MIDPNESEARMRATYDPDVDALSITLLDAPRARTVQVAPGILAHLDARKRLVELEILQASGQYDRATLQEIAAPVDVLTVAEAAQEAGLEASTLRRQIGKGRLVAEKRGHDWLVSRAALYTYLENREPRGRPAKAKKGRRRRAAAAR